MDDIKKPAKPRKNKYPAEGVTLEMMVTALVENYGWERLSEKIRINCFFEDPSIKSSLIFFAKNSVGSAESRTAIHLAV